MCKRYSCDTERVCKLLPRLLAQFIPQWHTASFLHMNTRDTAVGWTGGLHFEMNKFYCPFANQVHEVYNMEELGQIRVSPRNMTWWCGVCKIHNYDTDTKYFFQEPIDLSTLVCDRQHVYMKPVRWTWCKPVQQSIQEEQEQMTRDISRFVCDDVAKMITGYVGIENVFPLILAN